MTTLSGVNRFHNKRAFVKTANGRNGAGAMTLTGAKVGEHVASVIRAVTRADVTSGFESVITVADQIQQSGSTNFTGISLEIKLYRKHGSKTLYAAG